MKINDAAVNKMTTADDTDIIPIARAAYPYPASITVGNIRTAFLNNSQQTGTTSINPGVVYNYSASPSTQQVYGKSLVSHKELSNDVGEGSMIATVKNTATVNPATDTTSAFAALHTFVQVPLTSTRNISEISGVYVSNKLGGSGNITHQNGVMSQTQYFGSGTSANLACYLASYANYGTGTVTEACGIRVNSVGAGTITAGYGVKIERVKGTTKWSIYAQDSTAPSYFAAKVTCDGGSNITVSEYASNALALAGGLVAGDVYRNGDNLCIVH